MKLYTEEQVRDILQSGSFPFNDYEIDEILLEFTPIELPSDEEVRKESLDRSLTPISFQLGAKWVINQIEKQVIP